MNQAPQITYDTAGNWVPRTAYSGWAPGQREYSSWLLVAFSVLAIAIAIGVLKL